MAPPGAKASTLKTTGAGKPPSEGTTSSGGSARMASTRVLSSSLWSTTGGSQPRASASRASSAEGRRGMALEDRLEAEDGDNRQADEVDGLGVVEAVGGALHGAGVGDVLDVQVEVQRPGVEDPNFVHPNVQLGKVWQACGVGGAVNGHEGVGVVVLHRTHHRRHRISGGVAEASAQLPARAQLVAE